MTETALFGNLPEFPPAMPDDELKLLGRLPDWPTIMEVEEDEHAPCRRLANKGLVKISRQKDDPIAMRPTWYAGRTNRIGLVQ